MCKRPDLNEVKLYMFHDGKSSGTDRLHPEVIESGGRRLVEIFNTIIKAAWENIEIPADWKDVQLVTIFKKGG